MSRGALESVGRSEEKEGDLTRARAYVNTSLIRIKEIARNGNTVECGSSVGRNDVTAF